MNMFSHMYCISYCLQIFFEDFAISIFQGRDPKTTQHDHNLNWELVLRLSVHCLERSTSHRTSLNAFERELLKSNNTEKLHISWLVVAGGSETSKQLNRSPKHAVSWGLTLSFRTGLGTFSQGFYSGNSKGVGGVSFKLNQRGPNWNKIEESLASHK